jgi:hypothetical protein
MCNLLDSRDVIGRFPVISSTVKCQAADRLDVFLFSSQGLDESNSVKMIWGIGYIGNITLVMTCACVEVE